MFGIADCKHGFRAVPSKLSNVYFQNKLPLLTSFNRSVFFIYTPAVNVAAKFL